MGAHGYIKFWCLFCGTLNEVQQNMDVGSYFAKGEIPVEICNEVDGKKVYCDGCEKEIVLQMFTYHTIRTVYCDG